MADSNPRVPYQMASERPALPPLKGKPLMVHVVVNVEYWPFDQPMPRGVIPPPHGKAAVPDVGNYAWVEYGMRVGMPRLLRLLAERGVRASTFMNAMCADVYPGAAEAMMKADWEFVGHGWVQRSLAVEEHEVAVIEKSLARLEKLTGKRTRGWFGPGVGESVHTPDLLRERGIEWLSDWYVDDLPCWLRTRHGPMIAMPYTMELNDVPIWVVQGLPSDELLRRLEATLETFDDELAANPKVLTFGLHPHLVGVAHRASHFAKCLDLLLARNDTVFVTGSEIADWFVEVDAAPAFVQLPREIETKSMRREPVLLDVVALLADVPEYKLLRGQVGTVVELLDGAYEVEFSDDSGRTYAELALEPHKLLVLHHRPQQTA